MIGATTQSPRPVTGRMVLFCLIAFFAIVALANGLLVRFALTTFGGLETASSYQAGFAFAREAAAARAQDERHWQVNAKVLPAAGATAVEIDARDAEGRPLAGLEASAQLAHPTDRRADQFVGLREAAAGRFRGTVGALAGQWDLVIELSRDGTRLFRSRNRVLLP
jgi:nitrogen fixation protein FixH